MTSQSTTIVNNAGFESEPKRSWVMIDYLNKEKISYLLNNFPVAATPQAACPTVVDESTVGDAPSSLSMFLRKTRLESHIATAADLDKLQYQHDIPEHLRPIVTTKQKTVNAKGEAKEEEVESYAETGSFFSKSSFAAKHKNEIKAFVAAVNILLPMALANEFENTTLVSFVGRGDKVSNNNNNASDSLDNAAAQTQPSHHLISKAYPLLVRKTVEECLAVNAVGASRTYAEGELGGEEEEEGGGKVMQKGQKNERPYLNGITQSFSLSRLEIALLVLLSAFGYSRYGYPFPIEYGGRKAKGKNALLEGEEREKEEEVQSNDFTLLKYFICPDAPHTHVYALSLMGYLTVIAKELVGVKTDDELLKYQARWVATATGADHTHTKGATKKEDDGGFFSPFYSCPSAIALAEDRVVYTRRSHVPLINMYTHHTKSNDNDNDGNNNDNNFLTSKPIPQPSPEEVYPDVDDPYEVNNRKGKYGSVTSATKAFEGEEEEDGYDDADYEEDDSITKMESDDADDEDVDFSDTSSPPTVLPFSLALPNPRRRLCPVTFQKGSMFEHPMSTVVIDYANEYYGGPSTLTSTQEEILLMLKPEMLVGRQLCEVMLPHEAISVHGARLFCTVTGYGRSTRMGVLFPPRVGQEWELSRGQQQQQHKKNSILDVLAKKPSPSQAPYPFGNACDWAVPVIDAVTNSPNMPIYDQFTLFNRLRCLHKAYLGIASAARSMQIERRKQGKKRYQQQQAQKEKEKEGTSAAVTFPIIVAGGKWGCGVFNGNLSLKVLQQWAAATAAGADRLDLFLFDDAESEAMLRPLIDSWEHRTLSQLCRRVLLVEKPKKTLAGMMGAMRGGQIRINERATNGDGGHDDEDRACSIQ